MANYYASESLYIESANDLISKIEKYDQIIMALEDAAAKAAAGAHIDEYDLDDGQTKIKTSYRSPQSIMKAIWTFEQLKQRCINQLNGRQVALRDARSNNLYSR